MTNTSQHDTFDMFSSNMNVGGNSSYERAWSSHGQFDAMLEVLPENLDLESDPTESEGPRAPESGMSFLVTEPRGDSVGHVSPGDEIIGKVKSESEFNPQCKADEREQEVTIPSHSGVKSKPINIAQVATPTTAGQLNGNDLNLQNGEIAQLWDFNVDEFMMTPSDHSDSATISAPSSFTSDNFTPGSSINGFQPLSTAGSVSSNHGHQFGNGNGSHSINNSNWNQLLGHNQEFSSSHSGFQDYSTQAGLFQNNNFSQSTIRTEDHHHHHKGQPARRPSSRNLTNEANEDGALPLLSHVTTNLVKKTSAVKPLPSSTLPQYKRGSSSTNLPNSINGSAMDTNSKSNKPPTQCYNCKTLKTPLWRRDPEGNILCNACGLFQKLHGTMRPLSLKSDIIKKRNTKKRTKKDEKNTANGDAKSQVDTINSKTNDYADRIQRRPSSSRAADAQPVALVSNQTSLDQQSLNTHNKKVIPKSRRSSTSSSTSSKSSSSRSVVPILPKPSPSSRENSVQQFQYQMHMHMQASQPNSAASSPRYSNSPRMHPASPSTGIAVSIPRRKSTRALKSQSSSFMAQSLQQLHHQQHQNSNSYSAAINGSSNPSTTAVDGITMEQLSSTQNSGNSTISAPNSWSNSAVPPQVNTVSPNSPRSPFELFTNQNSQPKKSHKSLLSLQLQNTSNSPGSSSFCGDKSSSVPINPQTSSQAYNQAQQIIASSLPAASPRSSYVDTLQQQRGIVQYEQQQMLRRKTSSVRQLSSSMMDPVSSSLVKAKKEPSVMDDLDWLKFGI